MRNSRSVQRRSGSSGICGSGSAFLGAVTIMSGRSNRSPAQNAVQRRFVSAQSGL